MPVGSEQVKARQPSLSKFPQGFALKSVRVLVSPKEAKGEFIFCKQKEDKKPVLSTTYLFCYLDPEHLSRYSTLDTLSILLYKR